MMVQNDIARLTHHWEQFFNDRNYSFHVFLTNTAANSEFFVD